MKALRKLRALFFKDRNQVALNLASAEIKRGRAYLRPIEDPTVTYVVRSDDIEIFLNGDKDLSDADIKVLRKRESDKTEKKKEDAAKPPIKEKETHFRDHVETDDRFKKRTFSISLYQHEYDALIRLISEYGYKRADFILASANTATKGTMDREHKKIVKVHKELRKEEKTIRVNQKQANT